MTLSLTFDQLEEVCNIKIDIDSLGMLKMDYRNDDSVNDVFVIAINSKFKSSIIELIQKETKDYIVGYAFDNIDTWKSMVDVAINIEKNKLKEFGLDINE